MLETSMPSFCIVLWEYLRHTVVKSATVLLNGRRKCNVLQLVYDKLFLLFDYVQSTKFVKGGGSLFYVNPLNTKRRQFSFKDPVRTAQ